MTLEPFGKAHRMLAHLAEGDATLGDLRRAIGCSRKAIFVVRSAIERGLCASNQGNYFITHHGQAALRQLRAGVAVSLTGEA